MILAQPSFLSVQFLLHYIAPSKDYIVRRGVVELEADCPINAFFTLWVHIMLFELV